MIKLINSSKISLAVHPAGLRTPPPLFVWRLNLLLRASRASFLLPGQFPLPQSTIHKQSTPQSTTQSTVHFLLERFSGLAELPEDFPPSGLSSLLLPAHLQQQLSLNPPSINRSINQSPPSLSLPPPLDPARPASIVGFLCFLRAAETGLCGESPPWRRHSF
jgi:hypothetical protein